MFISAVTTLGLSALKDLLWKELNKDDVKIQEADTERNSLIHRNLDIQSVVFDEDEDIPYADDSDDVDEDEDDVIDYSIYDED